MKGDCGIEGFASDGTAYQCYAAQQCMGPDELLKKQRNKMTIDIGKFIKNEKELREIFGTIKISQWNLVVPYWNNKDLIKHANKKAAEVEALSLSHASSNFAISILTGDDFEVERALLGNLSLYHFDVAAPAVQPDELDSWIQDNENLTLVNNLARKAKSINAGRAGYLREKFQARIVAQFIGGSVVLGRLEQELPEVYQRVIEYKVSREANLEAETYVTTKVPAEFFRQTLEEYRSELSGVPGISGRVADTLAREAVADWLLRCPMEFD